VTCLATDLMGKMLAVGNVLGRTVMYVLETSEMLWELRCESTCTQVGVCLAQPC